MADLITHDHHPFRDPHTNRIVVACDCMCVRCFDGSLTESTGKGCICLDCLCMEQETSSPRLAAEYYQKIEKPGKAKVRRVENIVKDLPETIDIPAKTGTCRECGKPTYRRGTRGRFPVLCQECK